LGGAAKAVDESMAAAKHAATTKLPAKPALKLGAIQPCRREIPLAEPSVVAEILAAI
jgi:hypothetical protein